MVNIRLNRDMVPMKGHYFLFNAGTAPLVPYLPTYAKQLGFSTSAVGIMYTFLPILGLIAKPIFGAIGDRFGKHKFIFVLFQILTIGAFISLYFIPNLPSNTAVRLSCGDGETYFSTCPSNTSQLNKCKAASLLLKTGTANCEMTCDMSTPEMWQTVCEHWKIPNYCYTKESNLKFTSFVPKTSIRAEKDCVHLPINKTRMLDDKEYTPKCGRLEEISLHCNLFCPDKRINALLGGFNTGSNDVDMLCTRNSTYYTSCKHNAVELENFLKSFSNETDSLECNADCGIKKPWELPNICDGWQADETSQCKPDVQNLPSTVSFLGSVPLEKTQQVGQCIFFNLRQITMLDGSTHYPTCPYNYLKYNKSSHHFQSQCRITCDDMEVNSAFESISTTSQDNSITSYSFWILFSLMALNWIGMAVVVSIADAICFEKLGDRPQDFGKQRLWGSAGWGIFSLVAGLLIDKFSTDSENKDYTAAFVMMFIFLSLDVVVSCCLQYKQKKMAVNIFKNVGILFSSLQTCFFFLWLILVGMCTGLLWQFLFWYLEDLAKLDDCNDISWIKALQGLVNGIQCFGGEIPFFFISGAILKKIGHLNSMSLILVGFGLRFILYSILSDPWWTLPIELFQGLTFGMLFVTMNSYAMLISPPGIEATTIGLVGAIFEGVGTSLGSFVGGIMYGHLEGALTFRIFGCVALAVGVLVPVVSTCYKKFRNTGIGAEYSSIIRYGARNNDGVDILD